MNLLFKRAVKLEIATTLLQFTIEDLRVDFSVDLTTYSEPNSASFTIFNLSEMSRNALLNTAKMIRFSAGYDGKPVQIFKGEVSAVRNRREATGWITEIDALDGHESLKKAKFDKSFSMGTPVQTAIAAIAAAIGIPFELGFVPVTDVFKVGTTLDGSVLNCLNKVCKKYNLKWSIQAGVLIVAGKDDPAFSAATQMVVLTPDTGLVGSPVIALDEDPEKNEPIGSIEAVSLLNPKLLPDRPVTIAPENPATFAGQRTIKSKKKAAFQVAATGLYVIKRSRFVGSNTSGPFHTEIECPVWG